MVSNKSSEFATDSDYYSEAPTKKTNVDLSQYLMKEEFDEFTDEVRNLHRRLKTELAKVQD